MQLLSVTFQFLLVGLGANSGYCKLAGPLHIITTTKLWRLQVGFWPCNPNVPDLPGVRQRAAAIWTGLGNNIYIEAGSFSKILP
jgi:hypothetical protein